MRSRNFTDAPPWLAQIHQCLQQEFYLDLKLSELAERAGVHPVHLGRAFRRHYGQRLNACLCALRVEAARKHLLGSAAPVAQIAVACGFYDQAHLNKAFKQRFGMTPGEYRKIHSASR